MKKIKSIFGALLYVAIYLAVQIFVSFVFCLGVVVSISSKAPENISSGELYDTVVGEVSKYGVLMTLIANLLFVFIVWLIFALRKKKFLFEVGILKPDAKMLLPTALMGASVNVLINALFSVIPFPQSWVTSYESTVSSIMGDVGIVTVLTVVIFAPVAEELLFRGLVFTRISRGFGIYAGAAVSAVLFGVVHGNFIQGIYAALLGLLLAWVLVKTRSLIFTVVFHVAFNGIAFAYDAINVPMLILAAAVFAASVFAVFALSKQNDVSPSDNTDT